MKTHHIVSFIFLIFVIFFLLHTNSNMNAPQYDPTTDCATKMCPPGMGPACIPGDGSGAYLSPWPFWNEDTCAPICFNDSDVQACGNLQPPPKAEGPPPSTSLASS